MQCFECGKPAKCEHHVVPKSLGGTRTVPLCLKCHSIVHQRDFITHKRLQMIGIQKAKEKGLYTGRKPGSFKKNPPQVIELRNQGKSVPEISKILNVSQRTVFRYFKQIRSNGCQIINNQLG